jgi:hypothetical protein
MKKIALIIKIIISIMKSLLYLSILLLAGLAASGYLTGGCWGQGSAVVEALFGFGDAGLDPVGDEFVVGADERARLSVL